MKRPWFILIFFLLLVMGLSLAVPAEDVPETTYDESEPLPYEHSRHLRHDAASGSLGKPEERCPTPSIGCTSLECRRRCQPHRRSSSRRDASDPGVTLHSPLLTQLQNPIAWLRTASPGSKLTLTSASHDGYENETNSNVNCKRTAYG